MASFATLPPPERRLILDEVAARLGVVPVIVEKDFWVCWALGRIFATPQVAPHVVFKGGTSLSKVFGVIQRFSEDIDLAISPTVLGFTERELNEAPSASQRRKRMQALAAAGEHCVSHQFQPALEAGFAAALGQSQAAGGWLSYELDANAMVCECSQGSFESTVDGKTFTRTKGDLWTCKPGQMISDINKGKSIAVMRIVDLLSA